MPAHHWRKIWFNNPIERVNREIKTPDVRFSSTETASPASSAVLLEQHEERQKGERGYLPKANMRRLLDILNDQPSQLCWLTLTA